MVVTYGYVADRRSLQFMHSVSKVDVEAALSVLNFAIYHKDLTDMEEREQREREMEMKQQADEDDHNNDLNGGGGSTTIDAMELDDFHATEISQERIESFETILGQLVVASHLDRISIADIEQIVNQGAAVPYTAHQISTILKRMEDSNRIMIMDGIVGII